MIEIIGEISGDEGPVAEVGYDTVDHRVLLHILENKTVNIVIDLQPLALTVLIDSLKEADRRRTADAY